jgi:hypothetical protein
MFGLVLVSAQQCSPFFEACAQNETRFKQVLLVFMYGGFLVRRVLAKWPVVWNILSLCRSGSLATEIV